MKAFIRVLVNTLIANITTSFLWFGLTFWAYLETQSVLATAVVGGVYMLLVSISSLFFGTLVDQHRKKNIMVASSILTLATYLVGGIIYFAGGGDSLASLTSPLFWLFASIILLGSVIENMRNIALSTTVTILVPKEKHANANGLQRLGQRYGALHAVAEPGALRLNDPHRTPPSSYTWRMTSSTFC